MSDPKASKAEIRQIPREALTALKHPRAARYRLIHQHIDLVDEYMRMPENGIRWQAYYNAHFRAGVTHQRYYDIFDRVWLETKAHTKPVTTEDKIGEWLVYGPALLAFGDKAQHALQAELTAAVIPVFRYGDEDRDVAFWAQFYRLLRAADATYTPAPVIVAVPAKLAASVQIRTFEPKLGADHDHILICGTSGKSSSGSVIAFLSNDARRATTDAFGLAASEIVQFETLDTSFLATEVFQSKGMYRAKIKKDEDMPLSVWHNKTLVSDGPAMVSSVVLAARQYYRMANLPRPKKSVTSRWEHHDAQRQLHFVELTVTDHGQRTRISLAPMDHTVALDQPQYRFTQDEGGRFGAFQTHASSHPRLKITLVTRQNPLQLTGILVHTADWDRLTTLKQQSAPLLPRAVPRQGGYFNKMQRTKMPLICASCGDAPATLGCTHCGTTGYCSHACGAREGAWSQHQQTCAYIAINK